MKHDLSQQELALWQIDSCFEKSFFFFLFSTLTATVVLASASVWSGKIMGCILSRTLSVPGSNCISFRFHNWETTAISWQWWPSRWMHSKRFNNIPQKKNILRLIAVVYNSTIWKYNDLMSTLPLTICWLFSAHITVFFVIIFILPIWHFLSFHLCL